MADAIPDKIGSLLFCRLCGSLLDLPGSEDVIKCTPCGTEQDASVYDDLSIVTRSHPSAFPSILRQKRQLVSTASTQDNAGPKQATIREKCPKCGQEEVNFHTVQMRSADEGSTVFYDCPKCNHSWSVNN